MKRVCFVVASLFLGCALILGCAPQQQPPPQVACDGQPNWCVVASNEGNEGATVYVDGQSKAYVPAGSTVKIPLHAAVYVINDCNEWHVGGIITGHHAKKCDPPKEVLMHDNYTLVITATSE